MNMTNLLLIGGAALALLIIVWAIATYNRLVTSKAYVNEGWSGVDVQLKRRYDLIPNLVETVKGYKIHESSTLEQLARYRSAALHASDKESRVAAEAGLSQTLKTLFAVAENYPDLKANENFLDLQRQLATIEHELQLARRYYNGTVRNYNVIVQSFPSRIVAGSTGFTAEPYFELTSPAERDVPHVKF